MHRRRSRPAGRGRSARPALTAAMAGALLAAGAVVATDTGAPCPLVDPAVVTDRDTAPVLRAALDAAVSGGDLDTCARIEVVERDPATVASVFATGNGRLPGLWLPDSGLWPARIDVPTGGGITVLGSVATSPVVVVRPGAAAEVAEPVALAELVAAPGGTALASPERDTSGALTVLATATALAGDQVSAPNAALAAAFVALDRRVLPDATAGFRQLADDVAAVPFVATERSATVNASRDPATTVTTTPIAGVPPADYPLVLLDGPGADPLLRETGAVVLDALRGTAAREVLAGAGFAEPGTGGPPPPVGQLPRVLQLWRTLTADSALLAVVDVSGSMQSAAGPRTRIQLAADSAREGLGLFPPASEIGLWTFSARPAPAPDFTEVVPLGPLREPLPGGLTRAEVLAGSAAGLAAIDGGGTALNQTALEATRSMRAGFVPGREHTVVLLTDGRDEQDDGIALAPLLDTLRAEADPRRPVAVITIGIGPDADMDALRAISEATGGRAYQALDPAQMREVFLDALLLRTCRPAC